MCIALKEKYSLCGVKCHKRCGADNARFIISCLEHLSNAILPRNRFMHVHSLPIPNQWSHLVDLVKQSQETTSMYEEDLSPFPLLWILRHIFQQTISCFPTESVSAKKKVTSKISNIHINNNLKCSDLENYIVLLPVG